jgi:hypothetical protein
VSERPPPLPADLPPDLRAFVECRLDQVELRGGRAPWIPVPSVLKKTVGWFMRPSARIAPGPASGTATVAVKWAVVSLELQADVVQGRLALTADGDRRGLLDEVYEGVDGWVGGLNDWLAHNGYQLAPLDVASDRIALRKVPLQ